MTSTLNLKLGTWNSRRRRAVTIIEVLFSIMVTTVGLFGAIAIFPFASAQAKKAKQNDASASAGRSAVHMFDTLGMRRFQDRWYSWNPTLATPQYVVAPFNSTQSYCIDSRFVVRNIANWANSAQYFPYNSTLNSAYPVGVPANPYPRMNRIAFFPGTLAAAAVNDQFDRFNSSQSDAFGAPAYGRNLLLADSIFMYKDDLDFVRPGIDDVSRLGLPGITNDRSLPALQFFPPLTGGATATGTVTGPRPTQGHMSWMATLVPKIDLYANAGSDQFVLSIVVFNNRPTDLFLSSYALAGSENVLERTMTANFPGADGSTGGEVQLVWTPPAAIGRDDKLAEERMKVRANDWVLLSGNYGPGTPGRFQWYRVTHTEPEINWNTDVANSYSRFVTLMGQDWNIGMALPQATLVEGVVAVYEKTIRLDYGSTF